MIAVAHHHANLAVEDGTVPRVVGRKVLIVVALHVSFVHSVDAVGVKHGVHLRLARIVRCAYGVDVGLLHESHVAEHCLGVDGASVFGMCVLRVDTLEEHALAVDIYKVARLGDLAETVLRGEHHFVCAVSISLTHHDGVEIRIFCAPGMESGKIVELYVYRLVGAALVRSRAGGYGLALSVKKLHVELLLSLHSVTVVHGKLHVELSACGVVAERRSDVVVRDEHLRSGYEIDVTMDA